MKWNNYVFLYLIWQFSTFWHKLIKKSGPLIQVLNLREKRLPQNYTDEEGGKILLNIRWNSSSSIFLLASSMLSRQAVPTTFFLPISGSVQCSELCFPD